MKIFKKKIISLVLVTVLLITGNFAYALTHLECITENAVHHSCEMECCQKSDCCFSETGLSAANESLASDDMCCEIHIEQAPPEHDYAVLYVTGSPEKIKAEYITALLCSAAVSTQDYTSQITHRFKTSDICIQISNLRI